LHYLFIVGFKYKYRNFPIKDTGYDIKSSQDEVPVHM
jgi:hypothetical protein